MELSITIISLVLFVRLSKHNFVTFILLVCGIYTLYFIDKYYFRFWYTWTFLYFHTSSIKSLINSHLPPGNPVPNFGLCISNKTSPSVSLIFLSINTPILYIAFIK